MALHPPRPEVNPMSNLLSLFPDALYSLVEESPEADWFGQLCREGGISREEAAADLGCEDVYGLYGFLTAPELDD